jgi:hypothetical protein
MSAGILKQGEKRFLQYSAFGWGIPSLVVLVSWILEIKYRSLKWTNNFHYCP